MPRIPGRVWRADRLAKDYINRSDCRVAMYAEVARGGKVIARGYNRKNFQSSTHAEEDALRQLVRQKKGAEGATITVIRYLADDSFGASKPCPRCMEQLIDAGIKRINYFDYDGNFHTERL
jgi:deoxycytidylate deaminase